MRDPALTDYIERLKLRTPIEDCVRARVPELKRAGALFQACCPFHEERSPSFKVDPRKQSWRCYGACAEGGDTISFLMRFEHLSFMEALEQLGREAGFDPPPRSSAGRSEHPEQDARLYACLSKSEQLYQRALRGPEGRAALDYLRSRGFADPTLDTFGVGFAPPEGGIVRLLAREHGFTPDELIRVGLARTSDDGRTFEFFKGRVMLPIRDSKRRTVGFGARVLPGAPPLFGGREAPKYLNTGETALFHKGRVIYAYDRALEHARRTRRLVLCEGYTDVMAMHQAGLSNVVAVLGTAFTEEHAALVRRAGVKRVTMLFDGDDAGRRATTRALHGLLPLGIERIDIAVPKDAKDPGELLERGGRKALEDCLEGAQEWFPELAGRLRQLEARAQAGGVNDLLELVQRLKQPVEREGRYKELARLLELPLESVRLQAKGLEGRRRDPGPGAFAPAGENGAQGTRSKAHLVRANEPAPTVTMKALEETALRQIFGACLREESLFPVHQELLESASEPQLQRLVGLLAELRSSAAPEWVLDAQCLANALGEDPLRELVFQLEHAAETAESPVILAESARKRLEEARLDQELKRAVEAARHGDDAALSRVNSILETRRVRDRARRSLLT